MEERALGVRTRMRFPEDDRGKRERYHSVEFSLKELSVHYQFKIWDTESMPMCVLVREDSDILRLLKVGDTLNVQYYSLGSAYPSDSLATAIRHITRNDQGRFKGHFLVGLEILEGPQGKTSH